MNMFHLSRIIRDPTRITSTTPTVLDLILLSDAMKVENSGVSDFHVSDHLMIHCTCKCKRTPIN